MDGLRDAEGLLVFFHLHLLFQLQLRHNSRSAAVLSLFLRNMDIFVNCCQRDTNKRCRKTSFDHNPQLGALFKADNKMCLSVNNWNDKPIKQDKVGYFSCSHSQAGGAILLRQRCFGAQSHILARQFFCTRRIISLSLSLPLTN